MNAIGQINSDMSAALAVDLASNIWSEAEVFHNHGIDPKTGSDLLRADWFKKMLDETRSDWNAITNAKQRIRLKAQVALEESLEHIFAIVSDKNTPAAARVAAFKELKDISGTASTVSVEGSSASGPQVNIFLQGSDSPAVSIQSRGSLQQDDNDIIDVTPEDPDEDAGFILGMENV